MLNMFEENIGTENIDLNNSYNEDDVSSQQSSSSFSEFERDIHRKMPELHSEGKTKINTRLANGSESLDDEEIIALESSPRSCATKCSQNLSILSHDEEIFDSPEKSSTPDSFDELSFAQRDRKSIPTKAKAAEYKALLSKVNDAYISWKVNEFVLDTIKEKSTSWTKQIKEVTKSSEIQCNIKLKSENGEITNLLGLEEEDIKLSTSRSLALFSKSAFRDHAVEVVRANVAKLKQQKKSLQNEFGAHSMKVTAGVVTRERMEQLELQRHVEDLQNQARHLLSSSHMTAQQLATLRHNSDRHLQAATFALLRNKALYLQTAISTLKEKLDQSLLVDENMKEKMDNEGDNLKTQVTEMREELQALQKTLTEYEKREATSNRYKEIVAEFGKLKKQLDHKNETLKMLNDPNISC